MRRWMLVIATMIPLSGCKTLIQENEQGSWIGIAPGGNLVLNQAIRVAQDRARVFFVNGFTGNSGASYWPSCALEVRRISRDGPQMIPARSIRIDRIQSYWTQVVDVRHPSAMQFQFASHGGDGGGGNAMIQTGFHFWLNDSTDRNLMRLTCLGILANPAEAYPPTIADIRTALGRIATLEITSIPR